MRAINLNIITISRYSISTSPVGEASLTSGTWSVLLDIEGIGVGERGVVFGATGARSRGAPGVLGGDAVRDELGLVFGVCIWGLGEDKVEGNLLKKLIGDSLALFLVADAGRVRTSVT